MMLIIDLLEDDKQNFICLFYFYKTETEFPLPRAALRIPSCPLAEGPWADASPIPGLGSALAGGIRGGSSWQGKRR